MPREDRRYPGPTAHDTVRAISAKTASNTKRRMSVTLRRDRYGLRRDGFRPAAEQPPLAQGPDGREEQRDEEHADQRRHEHPEEDAGPDRVTTRRTGPARRQQRRDTQDKRERGHEDRPQPLAAGLEGRVANRAPLGAQLVRELDDQDCVLGG